MGLSVKALAGAIGLLTAAWFLFIGLLNLGSPTYGAAILEMAASAYPGYPGPEGIGSVIILALYGLVDGAICGALLAWLYNLMAERRAPAAGAAG